MGEIFSFKNRIPFNTQLLFLFLKKGGSLPNQEWIGDPPLRTEMVDPELCVHLLTRGSSVSLSNVRMNRQEMVSFQLVEQSSLGLFFVLDQVLKGNDGHISCQHMRFSFLLWHVLIDSWGLSLWPSFLFSNNSSLILSAHYKRKNKDMCADIKEEIIFRKEKSLMAL